MALYISASNAKPHTASIATTWPHRKRVWVLNWSACSPDLSPIENIFYIMKQKFQQKRSRTVEQLESCITQEWGNIPLSFLLSLYCVPILPCYNKNFKFLQCQFLSNQATPLPTVPWVSNLFKSCSEKYSWQVRHSPQFEVRCRKEGMERRENIILLRTSKSLRFTSGTFFYLLSSYSPSP